MQGIAFIFILLLTIKTRKNETRKNKEKKLLHDRTRWDQVVNPDANPLNNPSDLDQLYTESFFTTNKN